MPRPESAVQVVFGERQDQHDVVGGKRSRAQSSQRCMTNSWRFAASQ